MKTRISQLVVRYWSNGCQKNWKDLRNLDLEVCFTNRQQKLKNVWSSKKKSVILDGFWKFFEVHSILVEYEKIRYINHCLIAYIWGKGILILVGSLNSGHSYLITTVTKSRSNNKTCAFNFTHMAPQCVVADLNKKSCSGSKAESFYNVKYVNYYVKS